MRHESADNLNENLKSHEEEEKFFVEVLKWKGLKFEFVCNENDIYIDLDYAISKRTRSH